MIFVWYIARITPEWAVLVRIASSVLSDVVWIPACFLILFRLFDFSIKKICDIVCRESGGKYDVILKPFSLCVPILLLIFFHAQIFKLIPVLFLFELFRLIRGLFIKNYSGYFLKEFIPAFAVIAIISFYYGGQLIPSLDKSENKALKVMTYNILGNAAPESRKVVVRTIRDENPDILCLVEYNPYTDPILIDREIDDIYPYSVRNRSKSSIISGEVVFSKYPMAQKKNVLLKHNEFGYLNFVFAEIFIDGEIINVIDVHLTTAGHIIDDVIKSKLSFTEKFIFASQFEITKDRKKYNEACSLYDYIEHFHDSTIICGDFNDTPNSRVYNLFSGKYNNAFSKKGWGLGSTFGKSYMQKAFKLVPFIDSMSRNIIRIDQIFATKNIRILSTKVVRDANGSDHKPVVSIMQFK